MNRLAGKVAIVTGAASGMGRAHALKMAGEGASVVVTDRNIDGARATVELIEAADGQAIAIEHDIASETHWSAVVDVARSKFGVPTVLVNNAGVYIYKAVDAMSSEEWSLVFDVNVRGTFFGCRAVIPGMKSVGYGSIVNVSSTFGLVGRAGFSAYCASKGAVRMFTKALAAELAEFGIRVNSVHPGTIETAMTQPLLTSAAAAEQLMGSQPLRRIGRPDEVSAGVIFLASDEASYVTGTELVIDGGYVAV